MTDVAPDGSPVAFYRRVPAIGEPELIHASVPAGATILDLGCGPGRIAGPLVELGHPVTGIDNGEGMIDALPVGVEGIVADAATVRLGRSFGAVLLVSHLVNDPKHGPAFVRTAAVHVAPDGIVIGETYPPGWDPAASVGRPSRLGDAEVTVLRAEVAGDRLDADVRYGVDGRVWSQSFTARLLDEPGLIELLLREGLAFDRWLERPGWFSARPGGTVAHPAKRLGAVIGRVPRYVRLGRALLADPTLSRGRKVAIGAGLAYLASPIDLVPGIIPLFGQLDDLAAVLVALRFGLRGCRPEAADAHLRAAGLTRDVLDEDLAAVRAAAGWAARGVARTSARVAVTSARILGRGAVGLVRAGLAARSRRRP
ncbi:MAG TPA: DUF1232 domain-containing protein [Candidatus Limnocylindrales bacterium]|nr:DUF1232 domain-containing protein [Candidatus Limnocylindrales bacterium]